MPLGQFKLKIETRESDAFFASTETLKDCESEMSALKAEIDRKAAEVSAAEERCGHLVSFFGVKLRRTRSFMYILAYNFTLSWNSTNHISQVTFFKLCDWSNSCIESTFKLKILYRIGSSWSCLKS